MHVATIIMCAIETVVICLHLGKINIVNLYLWVVWSYKIYVVLQSRASRHPAEFEDTYHACVVCLCILLIICNDYDYT